jgi:hypothetical protein
VSDDRPEGRDSAKRRCFKKDAESSSSAAVEVLHRIHDNRQKSQLKEDEQLQQILSRKDEKLNLQREFLKIQKNEMDMKKEMQEIKKHQHDEQLQLRKQENKIRAKHREACKRMHAKTLGPLLPLLPISELASLYDPCTFLTTMLGN